MVVGLSGASVQTAFRLGSVTAPLQKMVDYLVLVILEDPAQRKLLKRWSVRAVHVSIHMRTCMWGSNKRSDY